MKVSYFLHLFYVITSPTRKLSPIYKVSNKDIALGPRLIEILSPKIFGLYKRE